MSQPISTQGRTRRLADDDHDAHAATSNTLGILGIATGTGSDEDGRALFSPGLEVRHDQTASFLARTLDLLVEEGRTLAPG